MATEGARLALAAGFEAEPLPAKEEHKTWRTLLGEAERHDAKLVVVGAHGLSGARRLLLGSVSSAVVAHSRIPVLVVPMGAPSAAGDGPVLLCYDGSDSAKHAIGEAGDLVRRRRRWFSTSGNRGRRRSRGWRGPAARCGAWPSGSTRSPKGNLHG